MSFMRPVVGSVISRNVRPVVAGKAFTPRSLFAAGAAGVWFDPSDLSTVYQDAAGTTPATVGSVVGLILDKSGNGNHASQNTTASKPILACIPATGRRNLLTYTEDLGNASWAKVRSAAAGTNYLREDTTAASSHYMRSTQSNTQAGMTYTISVEVKADTRSWFHIGSNAGASTGFIDLYFNASTGEFGTVGGSVLGHGAVQAGDGFWRVYVSFVVTFTTVYVDVALATGDNVYQYDGDGASGAYIRKLQFEQGLLTAYQKVTSTYDVTEAGVTTLYYLEFDGVDDYLVTSSIDFSGTDKMSVFAGVRKASDVATGMIAELGTSTSSVNGTFHLACSAGGTSNYQATMRGTVAATASVTGYAAPITNIVGGTGDIAGDAVNLRVNAAQVAQSSSDLGTGNLTALALYIGIRAGYLIPFNGWLYGLIIAGKLANTSEINAAERWMNRKTGAY